MSSNKFESSPEAYGMADQMTEPSTRFVELAYTQRAIEDLNRSHKLLSLIPVKTTNKYVFKPELTDPKLDICDAETDLGIDSSKTVDELYLSTHNLEYGIGQYQIFRKVARIHAKLGNIGKASNIASQNIFMNREFAPDPIALVQVAEVASAREENTTSLYLKAFNAMITRNSPPMNQKYSEIAVAWVLGKAGGDTLEYMKKKEKYAENSVNRRHILRELAEAAATEGHPDYALELMSRIEPSQEDRKISNSLQYQDAETKYNSFDPVRHYENGMYAVAGHIVNLGQYDTATRMVEKLYDGRNIDIAIQIALHSAKNGMDAQSRIASALKMLDQYVDYRSNDNDFSKRYLPWIIKGYGKIAKALYLDQQDPRPIINRSLGLLNAASPSLNRARGWLAIANSQTIVQQESLSSYLQALDDVVKFQREPEDYISMKGKYDLSQDIALYCIKGKYPFLLDTLLEKGRDKFDLDDPFNPQFIIKLLTNRAQIMAKKGIKKDQLLSMRPQERNDLFNIGKFSQEVKNYFQM